MTEQEFHERMDRHLDVANGHMARGNEIMARSNEVMEGHREFIREMTRRNEVVTRELVREISAGREVLVDLHRESYAQREGIWTLIDELRRHGLGGRD
jgi:hypothetical protein